MSLAQALALVSANAKKSRKRAASNDDSDEELQDKVQQQIKEEMSYPNLTIYGGDYHGNILGVRVVPPNKVRKQTVLGGDESDSDLEEVEQKQGSSRLSAIALALAREKGIDPQLLQQKKQREYDIHMRPCVSAELHAGSLGGIAAYGRYVCTAGAQDETIKLTKRDPQLNRLKEFGALHRHDSTITCTTFTPSNDGQLFLSGSENGIIYVWSVLNKWDCIGVLKAHKTRIIAIAPHPTINMCLTLSNDGKLVMWDLRSENFNNIYQTELRKVKPLYGTMPLAPINMLFSKDGTYYSVLYARCVYTYHTMGEHAGKIMSVIEVPATDIDPKSNIAAHIANQFSCFGYLDNDHIMLGTERGEIFVFNVVSKELAMQFDKQHKTRVKAVYGLAQNGTEWLHKFSPMAKLIKTQEQSEQEQQAQLKAAKTDKNKKQKTSTQPQEKQQQDIQSNADQFSYVVSADSEGKIVLWQIHNEVIGSQMVKIEPKSAKKDDNAIDDEVKDFNNNSMVTSLDDIDEENDIGLGDYDKDKQQQQDDKNNNNTGTNKPKFSYELMTSTNVITHKFISHIATNTRITCLTVSAPFDASWAPGGGNNMYHAMGHVIETAGESRTQYEDATDKIWGKQFQEYAKNYREQKVKDFKLKVRDYHRMKAGKIKSLTEGDALKSDSAQKSGKIDGFGKQRFLKLDEQVQKEHQQRQKDKDDRKTKGQTKMSRTQAKIAKRANPALAGTIKARAKLEKYKGKKAPARGKRRF